MYSLILAMSMGTPPAQFTAFTPPAVVATKPAAVVVTFASVPAPVQSFRSRTTIRERVFSGERKLFNGRFRLFSRFRGCGG